jgi:glycogen(starch) synthase
MRVLMTTDAVGGVWMYSTDLTRGLLEAGAEVFLLSFGHFPETDQARDIEGLQSVFSKRFHFVATEFPLEWASGDSRIAESSRYLDSLIQTFRPDLLHSNQYCYGAIGSRVPRIVVAHSDVISWWHARYGEEPQPTAWLERYRSLVQAGLQGADIVVSPSNAQWKSLERHYGSLRGRGRVIYNGSTLQPNAERTRKLGAVTAGRLWDECKNTGIVALANLPLPVAIAGRVEDNSGSSRTSSASDLIQMLGHLDRATLNELLTESEIYLGTSLYEPFGLAPLEAAHAGCALVLSDIDSFREIWEDAALFFDPRDPDTLHDGVISLLLSPPLRRELAARARQRARDLYGLNRFVKDYLDLYGEVCQQGAFAHVA